MIAVMESFFGESRHPHEPGWVCDDSAAAAEHLQRDADHRTGGVLGGGQRPGESSAACRR